MDRSDVKVLLVDDDGEEYLLVKRYLASARTGSFQVTWASSFEAALDEANRGGHDVCLLDYQLGEHTGIELLKELRNSGCQLPVILLTGHASLELDLAAMEMGAFDFLEKGEMSPALLERSIRYTLAGDRARAALRRANEELENRVRERTAELARSNRELEQFAQMVASDLQGPLHTLAERIEGFLGEARGKHSTDGPAATVPPLRDTLHGVLNMELMIQSVLDFARAGRETRTLESIELDEVLQEAKGDLQDALAECGAQIEAEELPAVQGDPKLLRGLFRNLLDNAIRFRGEQPPHIRVACERKGDFWLISVGDNCSGIEADEGEDIFVMFHRGSRPGSCAGIGLGLAVCRKIVQYHGGRIWADSEPGKGSTFCFTLPAD